MASDESARPHRWVHCREGSSLSCCPSLVVSGRAAHTWLIGFPHVGSVDRSARELGFLPLLNNFFLPDAISSARPMDPRRCLLCSHIDSRRRRKPSHSHHRHHQQRGLADAVLEDDWEALDAPGCREEGWRSRASSSWDVCEAVQGPAATGAPDPRKAYSCDMDADGWYFTTLEACPCNAAEVWYSATPETIAAAPAPPRPAVHAFVGGGGNLVQPSRHTQTPPSFSFQVNG
jgi:hypothetical protein